MSTRRTRADSAAPGRHSQGARAADRRPWVRISLAGLVDMAGGLLLLCPTGAPLHAQAASDPRGWQLAGVPALNFDSDEGFGYGAVVEAYHYGVDGGFRPYLFMIQPSVILSTEGRREISVFFLF